MPVDSSAKRSSLMSMGRPMTPRLPMPDGSFANAEDRQHLIFRYAYALTAVILVFGNIRAQTLTQRAKMVLNLDADE